MLFETFNVFELKLCGDDLNTTSNDSETLMSNRLHAYIHSCNAKITDCVVWIKMMKNSNSVY